MAWACYCSNSKRGGGGQNVDQVLQRGWMADYFIVDSGDFHCREQMPDSNWYKHESRKVAREPLECSCRSKMMVQWPQLAKVSGNVDAEAALPLPPTCPPLANLPLPSCLQRVPYFSLDSHICSAYVPTTLFAVLVVLDVLLRGTGSRPILGGFCFGLRQAARCAR